MRTHDSMGRIGRAVVAVTLVGITSAWASPPGLTKVASYPAIPVAEAVNQAPRLLDGSNAGAPQTISATLGGEKGTADDSGPYWIRTVGLEAGQTLLSSVSSTDFDPVLLLFQADGTLAGASDDGGDGNAARLEYLARDSGTYLLAVVPHGEDGRGAFRLEAATLPVSPFPTAAKETLKSEQQNAISTIRIIDPSNGLRDREGRGYHDYAVRIGPQGVTGFEFSVSSIAANLRYQVGQFDDQNRYRALTGWYDTRLGRVGGGTYTAPQDGTYVLRVSATRPNVVAPYQISLSVVRGGMVGSAGGRYALLVGIDDYEDSPLSTCVNDANKIRQLLRWRFAFKDRNILQLTDGQATRSAIIDGFRKHLAQAGPNGVAVFFFSGHGRQVFDSRSPNPGDERDSYDEVLCLSNDAILFDDELNQLISELRTDNVLVMLDMCHAGTGTLGDDEAAKVAVKALEPVVRKDPSIAVSDRDRSVDRNGHPTDHVALVACQDDQRALAPSGDGDDVSLSYFTASLAKALSYSAIQKYTFEQIIRQARIEMQRLYGPDVAQRPAAEGVARGQAIGPFLKTPSTAP